MKMETRYTLHTTDAILASALRNSFHWCVYALTIAHSIPFATRIYVDAKEMRFNKDGYRYTYSTPLEVAQRAAAFDRGLRVHHWPDVILENPISVVPSVERGPREVAYKRTGQHARPERKCNPQSSRRWHGIKLKKGSLP